MADKYDLDKMLKEMEEDEPEGAARANRKLSQGEINEKFAERRGREDAEEKP